MMAYFLRFNGQGALNGGAVASALASCNELRLEFDISMPNSAQNDTKIYMLNGGGLIMIGPQSDRRMRIYYAGTTPGATFAFSNALPSATRLKLEVVISRSLANIKFFVDGALQTTTSISGGSTNYPTGNVVIGAETTGGSGRATFDLYGLKIYGDGSLIYNYDPSLSGGSGTTLPDAVAARNASQVLTWPADNSEWVFYSTGGTAYADVLQQGTYTSSVGVLASYRGISDTLNGGSYTSAGSTLAATQGYSSQLNGASYTSAGGQLSSLRGFSSTLQGATFASSGGQLTSTRGYGDTLTGGSYSYAGGILVSTVSGAAQSYVDALLGGSYASAGASLASSRGYNSQLEGGSYSSAGGSLSAFYGYSSTLNGGNYAYSGNRLISTWSGEVTVTIEGYTIRFADDSISAKFHADDVSAKFDNDHVSVTWRH